MDFNEMTQVLRTLGKVTHVNLQDPKTKVMPGISDKIGKRRRKASRSRSRGLERKQPICHYDSQYPPGCTVLECRFEADRPVARIVQVPADTAATARSSCLLVEMKPSSDSFSRVKPRREDVKQRVGGIDICSPNWMTEIDKKGKQLDSTGPKILRCSSSKKILMASYCDDKSPKQPVTLIECMTTPKGPLARVTQCSTKTKGSGTNYRIHLESKLQKDSSCKIIQPIDSAKRTIPDQKAWVSYERAPSERSIPCQKSKPEMIRRFPPKGELARPDAKFRPIEMCPMLKRLDDQRPQRLASEQTLRTEIRIESVKADKASACQKSTAAFKRGCLTTEKISGDPSRLPSTRELIARYKDQIPIYQLEKYELCRSRRNGLQDDCIPPLLRTILQKEEERLPSDKCVKREQNVDQNRTRESTNKILLYVE